MKRIITGLLAIHFLLGNILLPKGDFALLADIPGMYQQYMNIDDPQDIGIADFVVDYLLNGEAIFGADTYKGCPIPYASVQFQHAANPLNFILQSATLSAIKPQFVLRRYHIQNDSLPDLGYSNEFFRPPVTA
ncbi:hypothetical protein GCM10027037_35610 [Mucilaginibacter koreensis]